MNYIPINRSGEAIEFGIDTKDVINITEKRYVNESGDSINNLVIKENCKINQDLIVKGKIHVSNDLYANNNLNVNKDLNINGNINCESLNKKNKSQDDEISKITDVNKSIKSQLSDIKSQFEDSQRFANEVNSQLEVIKNENSKVLKEYEEFKIKMTSRMTTLENFISKLPDTGKITILEEKFKILQKEINNKQPKNNLIEQHKELRIRDVYLSIFPNEYKDIMFKLYFKHFTFSYGDRIFFRKDSFKEYLLPPTFTMFIVFEITNNLDGMFRSDRDNLLFPIILLYQYYVGCGTIRLSLLKKYSIVCKVENKKLISIIITNDEFKLRADFKQVDQEFNKLMFGYIDMILYDLIIYQGILKETNKISLLLNKVHDIKE